MTLDPVFIKLCPLLLQMMLILLIVFTRGTHCRSGLVPGAGETVARPALVSHVDCEL